MTPVCRTCSQPIVRGAYLPWTHVAPRPGRGHYAYPAPGTFVDPRRATRSGDHLVSGAAGRHFESPDDSQPVGASAPESQSLPSGLSTG